MTDAFSMKAKEWDNPVKVAMTATFAERIDEKRLVDTGSRLMDVGCGTGLAGLAFADRAKHLTMVDTSNAMLDVLRGKITLREDKNITVVHGDISQVRQQADIIISFMALHHIDDTVRFIAEAKERLAENGVLVIGDLYAEDGSFHGDEIVPHNGFDTGELARMMERAGFTAMQCEPLTTISKNGGKYELFFISAKK